MSEFNEFDNEEPEFENEEDQAQFNEYKEEQDALNNSDEFVELYGFQHECRCAEDWAEGNLGVVSVCYLEMCRDALEYLKQARKELADKDAKLAQARIFLVEAGVNLDETSA